MPSHIMHAYGHARTLQCEPMRISSHGGGNSCNVAKVGDNHMAEISIGSDNNDTDKWFNVRTYADNKNYDDGAEVDDDRGGEPNAALTT